ncbi:type I polyketide synthase [Streptosporangium sp. NPDC048865]|uniref:type I polyketide synthase n=1 Tax=Streptosporangium sp. NPDC048865 TaxID=3155766 RepID=UPI003419F93F
MIDDTHSSAVAIVGMSGRFPGARDLGAYWENLKNGVCSITDFTPEELIEDGADPAEVNRANYVRSKGVLAGADRFEADLFGFSPKDAAILDPQHRLLLETAWSALEDAGYNPRAVPGTAGVYVGGGLSDHAIAVLGDARLQAEMGRTHISLLTDKDSLASWISYRLALTGPSMTVGTACSTSLTAVHVAVQSLLSGECSLAVAGGAGIDTLAKRGYLPQEGGIASAGGRCRPFDERSDGTLPGNGVGLVVLRRYEDALRDGDRIHCLIRGSAVTNDGNAKIGFTAPGTDGQRAAITEAMAAAGVTPRDVQYIEMHGTGTALGDQIEVSAASQAFGAEPHEPAWCGIGSVKSNIGHLDTAAGIAGLIKTALMLENGTLVPTVGFGAPNPALGLEKTPFRVVDGTTGWTRPEGGRRVAGVTSVGMGGTNVHMILEEAPDTREEESGDAGVPRLLPLSALTRDGLAAAAEALARHLTGPGAAPLSDIARTLQTGRAELEVRGYVVAGGHREAAEALRSPVVPPDTGPAVSEGAPILLLGGEGGHYRGMGADLHRTFPVFRDAWDACARRLSQHHGIAPAALFLKSAREITAAERTRVRHSAVFTLEYAAARLWAGWGVTPAATVGYGLGEYVGAVLSGLLDLDDALDLVVARADLISRTEPGLMLAVALPEAEVTPLLGDRVALAAVHGPRSCVLSGPVGDIERISRRLAGEGTAARRLDEAHALHSPSMDPVLDEFEAVAGEVVFRRNAVPYFSAVTGGEVADGRVATARYWRDQLRGTVRYAEALRAAGRVSDGPLLQIGAAGVLAEAAGAALPGRPRSAALGEGAEARRALSALGDLWASRQRVDWPAVTPSSARRAHLPGLVFDGAPRGAYRLTAGRVGETGAPAPSGTPEGTARPVPTRTGPAAARSCR